jgi:hypothetical protein
MSEEERRAIAEAKADPNPIWIDGDAFSAAAPAHCTGETGVAVLQEVYGAACTPAGAGAVVAF